MKKVSDHCKESAAFKEVFIAVLQGYKPYCSKTGKILPRSEWARPKFGE